MISDKEYRVLKYIQKHPKLSDILEHFHFVDYFELYDVFSENQRIMFSDCYIDSNTEVTISPKTLAEFDDFRRKSYQFWLPATGSVIAFLGPKYLPL